MVLLVVMGAIPSTTLADSGGETRRMKVTAYCACEKCCGANARGLTASGKPVSYNGGKFVAGPKDLPFGTTVHVPGYGTVKVIDRGGAIQGNRLDVYFQDHRKAREWGIKYMTVKVSGGASA